jgi:hypothetical protein
MFLKRKVRQHCFTRAHYLKYYYEVERSEARQIQYMIQHLTSDQVSDETIPVV